VGQLVTGTEVFAVAVEEEDDLGGVEVGVEVQSGDVFGRPGRGRRLRLQQVRGQLGRGSKAFGGLRRT